MRVRILDTLKGVLVWTSELDPDEVAYGMWSCDCMRASMFNPRRDLGCAGFGMCRGHRRWVVVDMVMSDDSEMPTMHECNHFYPEELLVVNGVELD